MRCFFFVKKEEKTMKRSTRLLTMLHFLPTGAFLRLAYLNETGHLLHLKNPQRFNEKLNALKLHSAAPTWSRYVDKLEARAYVTGVIGEEHLVPLIAQYNSVEEIDWSALTQRLESPQGIPQTVKEPANQATKSGFFFA